MHESASARHWRHSARLCLPLPVTTRPGGGGTTGPIDIAKFNAITVDAIGESGMTPAQVIEKVGFTGERFDKPTNTGGTSTYLFRESPKKYIEVTFNRNEKATDKVLYGIDFITLQKYQDVQVTPTGGTTLEVVNTSFGVTGVKANSSGITTTYRWQQGSKNTVSILFFNSNARAIRKTLTGGLPGILTKAKYDGIVVGNLGTPGTGGGAGTPGTSPTFTEVNDLIGFTGTFRSFSTTTLTFTYRWAESLTRYVEVDFRRDRSGASTAQRAAVKRSKGVPGVPDTP